MRDLEQEPPGAGNDGSSLGRLMTRRQLISGDWKRDLQGDHIVSADRLTTMASATTAHFMQNATETDIRVTQNLFYQFGLEAPDQVLEDWQDLQPALNARRRRAGRPSDAPPVTQVRHSREGR
ncbi:hypothetical protein [Nocardioides ferulae]|uniref:hypothetical protein n=1 Tax=Nocardioides ferulae TaxID=2340821 RepID=UPI000EAF8338|nr:hypothetical protein [Nocardioides ferulae]